MVERRRVAPGRFEWNLAPSRVARIEIGATQPRLGGGDQERHLRGVALHEHFAGLDRDLCVVAQSRRGQRPPEHGIFLRVDSATILVERPFEVVASAGQHELASPGVDCLHGHPVLGQGARLVGPDHRATAESFDGGQLPDDHLPPDHPTDCDRQRDRQHDRETLWNRRHDQRDECEEQRVRFVANRDSNDKRNRNNDQRSSSNQPREPGHPALERCDRDADLAHRLGDLTDLRRRCRRGDHRLRSPTGDRGSSEEHIATVR